MVNHEGNFSEPYSLTAVLKQANHLSAVVETMSLFLSGEWGLCVIVCVLRGGEGAELGDICPCVCFGVRVCVCVRARACVRE